MSATRTEPRRFSGPVLDRLASEKMIGIRSGRVHRFTGVWAVVVRGRVFVRSWNDKETGWYRAFLEEPRGEIRVGGRVVRVRAKRVRDARRIAAIERAYAEKYDTKASQKWVRGFRAPRRRATTTEFVAA
ncbi:MAG TPA: nitroreductase/quinone reductase family protein [Thermoanaerobaculia bacterium]|nr:nitroreductase/quinone reductase family protein [Thermoanaerobaculia bacterium]